MKHQRIMILLRDDEVAALLEMARRDRRTLREQIQWIVAKTADEAGLLDKVGVESLQK